MPTLDDLTTDSYLVVGLATCFIRTEDGVDEIKIIEPIPSAALEILMDGSPTSYEFMMATTLGAVVDGDEPQLPAGFPDCQIAKDFVERAIAAARTYQRKPAAQNHIPQGTTKSDMNYSVERKRVLNAARKISKSDNVKQHAYTHQKL
jgi:hypothetical protein